MAVTEWLKSTAALISAVAALLASIGAIWPQISRLRNPPEIPVDEDGRRGTVQRRKRIGGWFLLAGALLFVYSFIVLAARFLRERGVSPAATRIESAWAAFGKGDYSAAIRSAEACTDEIGPEADREQAALEKGGTPFPPTGAVSKEESATILARGALNDAATCYYIKGRAAEKLGRKEQAQVAYLNAAWYTYARTWDPSGWFWSPTEAASDRLQEVR